MLVSASLIELTRTALRIKTHAFDDELRLNLEAAILDLGVAGVVVPEDFDQLVTTAAITYAKLHFGQPDDYDRLKASYDEQKAQLVSCTGYTDWGFNNG